jgi:predicted transcriptional regulator
MAEAQNEKLLALTSQIVAAHVSHNSITADALPGLIHAVYKTLLTIEQPASALEKPRPEPAVSPRRSVFAEYIVCLEDGKKLKMLRRHLKTAYKMTPEQYRERWNLAPDYPMTAPNYAKQRSKLAKQIGLGTKSRGGKGKTA